MMSRHALIKYSRPMEKGVQQQRKKTNRKTICLKWSMMQIGSELLSNGIKVSDQDTNLILMLFNALDTDEHK